MYRTCPFNALPDDVRLLPLQSSLSDVLAKSVNLVFAAGRDSSGEDMPSPRPTPRPTATSTTHTSAEIPSFAVAFAMVGRMWGRFETQNNDTRVVCG